MSNMCCMARIFIHMYFKDSPKSLSNYGFDRDHLRNVWKYMTSLEDTLLSAIKSSRNVNEAMIREFQNGGSISAENAITAGLIDLNTPINPLSDFLFAAKNEDNRKEADFKWGDCMKKIGFGATEAITMASYNKAFIRKEKRAALIKRLEWVKHSAYEAIASVPLLDIALDCLGIASPYFSLERASSNCILKCLSDEFFLTFQKNQI